MSLPIILMYLCIPLFGNGLYFLSYGSDGPECGITCIIFFNVAFFCLFLPNLFDSDKETNARGVRQLLATSYLVLESLVAFFFIVISASQNSALVIQGILLGVYLILFFGIAAADKRTVAQNQEFQAKKSVPLHQARLNLQLALANHTDPRSQATIRDLLGELNSAPIHSNSSTEQIENLILTKSMEVASNPHSPHVEELIRLLSQYKTIISFSN